MAVRYKRPVPDDWQEVDGYCVLSFTVPNSPKWKATYFGVLTDLESEAHWDDETGDPAAAVEVVKAQFKNRTLNCSSGAIPVWVEYGTLVSYANGVYTIEPEYDGQGWYAKIWLNHDGVDFVDADTHYLTTDAQNYIPDPPTEEIYIYDRSDNVLYSGLHVTDYGHALLGAVDFWSTTQTFTALVTLGDVWP